MEYKNKSASLTPGFTFPRKGENPLEVFGSAEKIITASVGSYDLDDKYSMVKNIPTITLDGKKLITKITEDLIKLLSK